MSDDRTAGPDATGPTGGRDGTRRRGGEGFRYAWGVILILVGAWFFVERTLRIDLPTIPWDDLWPVFLIGLGVWVVLRGASRRNT